MFGRGAEEAKLIFRDNRLRYLVQPVFLVDDPVFFHGHIHFRFNNLICVI